MNRRIAPTLASATVLLALAVVTADPVVAASTAPASAVQLVVGGQPLAGSVAPLAVDTNADGTADGVALTTASPALRPALPQPVSTRALTTPTPSSRIARAVTNRADRLTLARTLGADPGLTPGDVDRIILQAAQVAIWNDTSAVTPAPQPYGTTGDAASRLFLDVYTTLRRTGADVGAPSVTTELVGTVAGTQVRLLAVADAAPTTTPAPAGSASRSGTPTATVTPTSPAPDAAPAPSGTATASPRRATASVARLSAGMPRASAPRRSPRISAAARAAAPAARTTAAEPTEARPATGSTSAPPATTRVARDVPATPEQTSTVAAPPGALGAGLQPGSMPSIGDRALTCDEVLARTGRSDFPLGDPWYTAARDRDNDGTACESGGEGTGPAVTGPIASGPVESGPGQLAYTGAESKQLAAAGSGLLAIGAALVVATRKRRRA